MPSPGSQPPSRPILDVAGLTLRFGGLTSLDDVSLRQPRGTVLAVIGPNGAGKTSLFNCLTGTYKPRRGSAHFWPTRVPGVGSWASPAGAVPACAAPAANGEAPGGPPRPDEAGMGRAATAPDVARKPVELLGRSAHRVARLGIARTFQNIRLFGDLTALDNVRVGVEVRARVGAGRALLPLPFVRREARAVAEASWELLEFVGLADRAGQPAASLPYGAQRRLEIARALGTRPSLLLLDEPAAGATAAERRDLVELIGQIRARGVSILLIEHDIRLVAAVADTVLAMTFGKVIATGTPDEVRANPAVVEAYLGTAVTAS
ncbi:ABC transporter ATP-binding protein [Pseudofrankia inefficax]|uniref:ABC transporter ATP-binding protein n=1 Tax=Pseudofrankia inefficax (strain DSM 45817 / CECT 9037 / DDB 130130 / EuI1c) TaxID=298654 RepID=UPI000BA9D356|nr:ABC transporter ATP-binding protein [Pseudofrankia inefficax]